MAPLLKAAEAGNPSAMVNLGVELDEIDPARARYWYRRAADLGNLAGTFNLALCCRDDGDLRAATRWFSSALALAERAGNDAIVRDCCHNLAGLILDTNPRQARAFLTRAAEMGDTGAMVRLGQWTINSEPDESLRWFERAESLGDPNGVTMATWMRQNIRRAETTTQPPGLSDPLQALRRFFQRRRG